MKSILIIGMEHFGKQLASRLMALGNDVMIVDKNEKIIDEISPLFTDSQIGDCTNEGVLRSLGIANFDICFVAIGADFQSSMEITSMLKELGAKHVVSKAKTERQAKLLKKIGADDVIYPEREIAEKLAVRYSADNIFDYIELTGEYSIFEVPILADWIGQTIAAVEVRRKHKVNIIAIKRENNLQPMPGADYIFREGDHVVVIGKSMDVFKLNSKA